jgi:hypothetical protein
MASENHKLITEIYNNYYDFSILYETQIQFKYL